MVNIVDNIRCKDCEYWIPGTDRCECRYFSRNCGRSYITGELDSCVNAKRKNASITISIDKFVGFYYISDDGVPFVYNDYDLINVDKIELNGVVFERRKDGKEQ